MSAVWFPSPVVFAEAKGVAGLGKAGGDGGQGPDKAGQQVPPEVYMALTYAGTLFLFTLSVPLILYGLNKLLNKIEECLGCGASSKARKLERAAVKTGLYQQPKLVDASSNLVNQIAMTTTDNIDQGTQIHPNGMAAARQNNLQPTQRLGQLQFFQNQPKYSQFISMSSKPDYQSDQMTAHETKDHKLSIERHHHSPPSHLDASELPMARPMGDTRDYLEHGLG